MAKTNFYRCVQYPRTWLSRQNARGVRDVDKLLQIIIAQNEIIIRQNEKLLLLLTARANKKDAELLAELKKINRRQD